MIQSNIGANAEEVVSKGANEAACDHQPEIPGEDRSEGKPNSKEAAAGNFRKSTRGKRLRHFSAGCRTKPHEKEGGTQPELRQVKHRKFRLKEKKDQYGYGTADGVEEDDPSCSGAME